MLRRLRSWALVCGLVGAPWGSAAGQATIDSSGELDYVARIGVVSLTPHLLSLAQEKLPLGFYKDYSCFARESLAVGSPLTYMPIIQYKSKADSKSARSMVSIAWQTGQLPKLPGTDLEQLLVAMNLPELETWIVDHTGKDGFLDGTMFLLGNEPGYRPNNDDRIAEDIVQDALAIKELFSRNGLKHHLALGGIATSKNSMTTEAYGGKTGNEFFREILEAARDRVSFDAFVIHPYSSDLFDLSARESFGQIVEFRRIMRQHGQRDKPLFVGEVGVPFPAMRDRRKEACRYLEELVELCLTARDPGLGLSRDQNRLVQRVTWYLLSPPQEPIVGFTTNPGLDLEASALMQADGQLTDMGEALLRTVNRLVSPTSLESIDR